MKKILITISRGSLARNLFQNEFYSILCNTYKVVVLTTAFEDDRFVKEFSHPNVSFLNLPNECHTWLDRLFFFFHKNLIYNPTVDQKNHWGVIGHKDSTHPNFLFYKIKKWIFQPLSSVRFLREVVRFLDEKFGQRKNVRDFQRLLIQEKPDLVFATNIAGDMECALLKAAKKEKIMSLGMAKSWDNLTKHSFRAKADHLVVWSEFVKHQAVTFQNYREEQISIVGIPQFDYYTDVSRIWSREKFCKEYNFDPNKKIIFFGSEGNLFPVDSENAHIIYDLITQKEVVFPAQLLVRPHYGYKNDEMKFLKLFDKSDVTVDLGYQSSDDFRDGWDYSKEFMDRFLNSLYHSDIIINTCSTLSLDAMSFEKPVISLKFDGYTKLPYERSIARWYETYYYNAVVSTGAVRVVESKEELRDAINMYLQRPDTDKKERQFLKENYCYKIDGQSGKRLAELIEKMFKKISN